MIKNRIKVLGAYGGKSKEFGLVSYVINENTLIDAGNVINKLSRDELLKIENIFITHTHLDHLIDIPFLLDLIYENQTQPVKIFSTKKNIDNLKQYIFNNIIWPEFQNIKLINSNLNALEFIEIKYDEKVELNDIYIKAVKNKHIEGSCAFILNDSICITSDTTISDELIYSINRTSTLNKLIIETSFSNSNEHIAQISNHLTPNLLKSFLSQINNKNLDILVNHMKPSDILEIKNEILQTDFTHKISFLVEDKEYVF